MIQFQEKHLETARQTLLPKNLPATANNISFNVIIPTGWGWQFLLKFTLTISFDCMHPLFSTILPFPSYFNFHNLTYLETDVSTHDMTIPPQKA